MRYEIERMGWLVAARLIGDMRWYEAVHSLTIALGRGLQQ
jgi:hypothetical protein